MACGGGSSRLILYDNYLSNVSVEFISSDQDVDTVIEQSTSGNLSRDEEIKLTFSYGEELGYNEVKLIDFTNKSKFEIEFKEVCICNSKDELRKKGYRLEYY